MRIPVYKSTGRPTSEAPGARITARMNAQPFVQAELQKGAIATEVANQVGEYANMRYKMITETQKNEAIFSAKEGLMALSSQLEKDKDVTNIFDGELKYAQGVKGVYDEMRATVGKNKYALQDFDNSFRQMEIPIKFRLQEVVDLKIEKRRQAALKARRDQQVSIYSDPYLDVTSDELAMEQAQLESMVQQAVRNGGVNPEIMGNVTQKVLSEAFKNLIPAYAGTDLNKAIGLSSVLSQIQQVRSGELEPGEMSGISSLPPHVLNMLMAVPAEEANAVVQDTIQMASTFFTAQEKINDEIEEEKNKDNVQAYNLLISLDSTEDVSEAELLQVLDPIDMKKLYDDPNIGKGFGKISGTKAKKILYDGLIRQMWATPAQQKAMEDAMVDESTLSFRAPEKGDPDAFSEANGLASAGQLTVEYLNSIKGKLDLTQHTTLRNKITVSGDKSYANVSKIVQRRFNYDAKQAQENDPELAAASRAAFELVDGELIEEILIRKIDGNPMTGREMLDFAKEKMELYDDIYLEELRDNFEEELRQDLITMGFGQITPEFRADPFKALEDWYTALPREAQDQISDYNGYIRARSKIRKYSNKGLF